MDQAAEANFPDEEDDDANDEKRSQPATIPVKSK